MELFDDMPEDWKHTSNLNIKALVINAMYVKFRKYPVLGKVVQHGVEIKNVNKHSFKIKFKYRSINETDIDVQGDDLEILFIVNYNKPTFKMIVGHHQTRTQYDYGTIVRCYVNEQSINSKSKSITINYILKYLIRTCIQFKQKERLNLHLAQNIILNDY